WLLSAAVVTTSSNGTVSELHDRMPAILTDDEWPLWLDPMIADAGLLRDLLHPADDALLQLDAASPMVNDANNEGPELLTKPPETDLALTLFG
ncbi:MAG: SOS response-associated peptidase family protein, partial [Candidatus Limnocylindrales bacterium]